LQRQLQTGALLSVSQQADESDGNSRIPRVILPLSFPN
jgi:hypothetical protein